MPDDTSKTLVGPEGQLLYDYGGEKFFAYANSKGFKTVFHILADEGIRFESQKLYSPKVPIVKTSATFDGLKINQEAFAYSSAGLDSYGKKQNWLERKTAPREDIVLIQITNNTNEVRTFKPMVVVNSEFEVSAEGGVITVNGDKHLIVSHQAKQVRPNLGKEKTLARLKDAVRYIEENS